MLQGRAGLGYLDLKAAFIPKNLKKISFFSHCPVEIDRPTGDFQVPGPIRSGNSDLTLLFNFFERFPNWVWFLNWGIPYLNIFVFFICKLTKLMLNSSWTVKSSKKFLKKSKQFQIADS